MPVSIRVTSVSGPSAFRRSIGRISDFTPLSKDAAGQ
jgi:hypothetical protein